MLEEAFQVGDVRVEPARNLLLSETGQFSLEPRIMDVLCLLASDPGTVFSRETLVDRIWRVEFGADESLTRAVSIIRKTFREAGEQGQLIETIPRKGYRLATSVSSTPQDATPAFETGVVPRQADRDAMLPASDDTSGRPLTWPRPVSGTFALLALVVGLLFVASAWFWPDGDAITIDDVQLNAPRSIAVLPFEPLSANEEDDRVAYGITEDLTHALSAVEDLSVAARKSSYSFRGEAVDVREIGRVLGVNFVVDGTVRRNRDTVRVTAQLVRTADGFVVWSDAQERPFTETFALENEIVRDIGLALELRLGVGAGKGLAPSPVLDARAVEFYYEGLQQYGNRFLDNGSVQAAQEALRAAVDLEPDFAKAWSALARIGIRWSSGPLAREKQAFLHQLDRDIARALELNPKDPALHAALVYWHSGTTLDLNQAQHHLAMTERLAPEAVEALLARSAYYWVVGQGETSLDLLQRAQRRDPLNNVLSLAVAQRQAMLGDFNTAFEFFDACQQTNCLQEGFVAYASAAAIYSGAPDRIDRWAEFYDTFEAFTQTLPTSLLPKVVEVQGAFYSTGFRQADASEEQAQIVQLFEQEIITDHIGMWGPTFAGFLPEDVFFEMLSLAYERGDLLSSPYAFSALYGANPYPVWVLEHPRYHHLWEHPRLEALAEARRENGQFTGLPKP